MYGQGTMALNDVHIRRIASSSLRKLKPLEHLSDLSRQSSTSSQFEDVSTVNHENEALLEQKVQKQSVLVPVAGPKDKMVASPTARESIVSSSVINDTTKDRVDRILDYLRDAGDTSNRNSTSSTPTNAASHSLIFGSKDLSARSPR